MTKHLWIVTFAAFIGLAAIGWSLIDQTPKSIRIGYAISLSGVNAQGAGMTVLPNYRLWAKEVNDSGGILLKAFGKRVPIEVIEYDDQSNAAKSLEAIEKLIAEDEVDFILPPWGTGSNLNAAPLLHEAGYPHLAVTAMPDRVKELTERWPNSFWFLGAMEDCVQALVAMLDHLRSEKKAGNKIAIVNVADQLGIKLSEATRKALRKHNFDIVYDRSYSVQQQNMDDIVVEAKQVDADIFLAFSYPPDTMAITEAARSSNFNPKIFYTGVGTAFPRYEQHFGADAEGVMGIGGWNSDTPASKDYSKRHLEFSGKKPDYWASPVTYASLQMLQQAIENVGKIDREATIRELQRGPFQTILGQIKLENNMYKQSWSVGQWQDGNFWGVAPANFPGARAIIVPKPAWRAGS